MQLTKMILFDFMRFLNLEITTKNVILKGRDMILELVKEAAGVLFWRILPSSSSGCSLQVLPESSKALNLTNIHDLYNYRHILGDCYNTSNIPYKDDGSLTFPGSDEKAFEPVSSAAISSAGCGSPAETQCSVSSPEVTTDSPTMSFDSDLLSMSDSSEEGDFQPLRREDPAFPILNAVVYRLLSEYQKVGIAKACESSNLVAENEFVDQDSSPGGSNGGSNASSSSVSVPLAPSQSSKRFCQIAPHPRGDDYDETPDDGLPRRPPKRRRLEDVGNSKKLLACPFWKLDASKHRGCFRMKLSSIPRVKQHLSRNHIPEFYCEYCLLISLDEESHQRHVMSRLCSPKSCEFNDLTHVQQRRLSKKSKSKLSESDQWFVIWDIVFPDQPRPASGYVDQDLSEDLCQFREYAQVFGSTVLAQAIRAHLPPATVEPWQESWEKA